MSTATILKINSKLPSKTVCPHFDFSTCFLYQNQISGSSLSSWMVSPNVHLEKGTPLIQASMQPVSWCSQWLSDDSVLSKNLKFKEMDENHWKCKIKQDRGKSRQDISKVNILMQILHHQTSDPTDVFYCHKREPIIQGPESEFQLIQYITEMSDNIIFISYQMRLPSSIKYTKSAHTILPKNTIHCSTDS